MVKRFYEAVVLQYLKVFPAVAILGSRQSGKSTLIKMMSEQFESFLYLDLQNMDDLNKLSEPMLFFNSNQDATICLDEIQNVPHLFSVLRSVIDKNRRNGRFILLGSASRDIIQHTSETLAGRIGLIELSPFSIREVYDFENYSLNKLWLRGGYPDSYLMDSDANSQLWINNFIRTYVERDIPQLGFQLPSLQIRRFLQMCAHNQGQILNLSKMASAMDVTHPTIKRYIDILEQSFVVRSIQPYISNVKKRLVKSPKVYIRDAGILHFLLNIKSYNDLLGHPVFGYSWEGFVIENIISNLPDWSYFFYRTSTGDEIDLILERGSSKIAIECKSSTAPKLSKGFWKAREDIKPDKTFVIIPSESNYLIKENVVVCDLISFLTSIENSTL